LPLDTPTAEELAQTNLMKAQAGQVLIQSGAISSEDERQRLATDKESGYNEIGILENEPEEIEGEELADEDFNSVKDAMDAAKWEEGKHPRAKNGQFGSGGGAANSESKSKEKVKKGEKKDFSKLPDSAKDDIAQAIMVRDAYTDETPYMDAWEECGRDIDDFTEKGIRKVLEENLSNSFEEQKIDPAKIQNKGRQVSGQFVDKYKKMLSKGDAPPIIVKKDDEDNYQIVEGGHRLQAAKETKASYIRTIDITDLLNVSPLELFKKNES